MSNVALLQAKAAKLSEPIAAEVLDFLEFVITKRELEVRQQPERIKQLRGSFKGRLCSSTEFASNKANSFICEI